MIRLQIFAFEYASFVFHLWNFLKCLLSRSSYSSPDCTGICLEAVYPGSDDLTKIGFNDKISSMRVFLDDNVRKRVE